jgi:hypothetical protein
VRTIALLAGQPASDLSDEQCRVWLLYNRAQHRYARRYGEWLRLDRAARRLESRYPHHAARYREQRARARHLFLEALYVQLKLEERARDVPDWLRACNQRDVFAPIDAARASRRSHS